MANTVQCADRTVALLGLSGTDKVAVLKRLFRRSLSEIESSQSDEVTAFSNLLGTTFLDTPALIEFSAVEIAAMVGKCCEQVKDGIDAILLFLPTKLRFSKEEVATILGLHEHFSTNFMGHFIVLFIEDDSEYKEIPTDWFEMFTTLEDAEDFDDEVMGPRYTLGLRSCITGLLTLCGERSLVFRIRKDKGKDMKHMMLANLVEDMVKTHHGRKLNLKDAFLTVQEMKQNEHPQDMGCNPYTVIFSVLLLTYLVFRELA